MEVNYIKPVIGQTYALRTGEKYRCVEASRTDRVERGECLALLTGANGWAFSVCGLHLRADGTAAWDYSTGGHWYS